MRLISLNIVLSPLILSGCAIHPPISQPSQMCNFVRYDLETEVPQSQEFSATPQSLMRSLTNNAPARVERAPRGREGSPTLKERILQAVERAHAKGEQVTMLFTSGGSLDGAFGAGFLDEWKTQRGHLPPFAVVTGISTGAILATYAFIDDTAPLVGPQGYGVPKESYLLTPIIDPRAPLESFGNATKVIRHGAVARLDPLVAMLKTNLDRPSPSVAASRSGTMNVLERVNQVSGNDRFLLVGVVDVDTGKAVALDLSDMAKRYVEAPRELKPLFLDCYARAIVASSSAPLAALPVFIDNRMYVDGGLRFGTFSDEIGEALASDLSASPGIAASQQQDRVRVIVNGDLQLEQKCGKADQKLCEPPYPTDGPRDAPHRDWNLAALAFRSKDILVNQNQRASVNMIDLQSRLYGRNYLAVRIQEGANAHTYMLSDPELGSGTMSCSGWHRVDHDTDHPVQFFPRFMRCLMDYGRERARSELAHGWD